LNAALEGYREAVERFRQVVDADDCLAYRLHQCSGGFKTWSATEFRNLKRSDQDAFRCLLGVRALLGRVLVDQGMDLGAPGAFDGWDCASEKCTEALLELRQRDHYTTTVR
jgi:hypothetical protein